MDYLWSNIDIDHNAVSSSGVNKTPGGQVLQPVAETPYRPPAGWHRAAWVQRPI